MKNISKSVKGNFAKSVIMLTSGTAVAQILTSVLSPIVTRIYSPSEYGILTIYTSVLGMISLLGSLCYESAIPIAEDDKKAINILCLCFITLLIVTFILLGIFIFWGDKILILLDAEALIKYKYFIMIGVFATGMYTILNNWGYRKKEFKAITKTKINQSIFSNIMKIGLGKMSFGSIGLILSTIIGQSAGITTLLKSLLNKNREIFKEISISEIIFVAKRYIKFPLYSAPTLFLISFSSQIPVIFLSSFYGKDIVGYYGLALNITFLPMTFIGKSIQDVFYSEAASIGKTNPEKVKYLSNKLLKKLILIGSIPTITLLIAGPTLFSLVFGDKWYEAGVCSRLICIYIFSHLIFHPISVVFSVFEQQKKLLLLNIIKIIGIISIFIVVKYLKLNCYNMILLLSIVMAFMELLKYIFAQKVMSDAIKINQ